MTRTHASEGTSVRSPGRPRRALAAAVLGALALTACGAEATEGGGKAAGPATSASVAGGASTPSQAATDGPKDGSHGAAFAAMLARVARSCPAGHAPADRPTAPAGGGEEPTVRPGEMPPTGPIEPGVPTSGPEVELSARDWCASGLHEERITQALLKLKDPAPAEVRKILNRLGYIDERIHDLARSGPTTAFLIDLREKGGRLCVKGSAAGENTVVDTCVAPLGGEFSAANVGN
ncbi:MULTISPECIES: hypothetical protein [unclassified Streptomyces]|uniref:hypothetical protein n=1 Tax=unclassified Streptomyces TaxID=2593676 RepID=UPI0007C96A4A|nr:MULTISPECIES: hypothetical protein [unclassified Streptomyces]